MVVEILQARRAQRLQAADQLRGRSQLPPAVRRAAARGAEGRRAADVRRLPAARGDQSAARARLQSARPTSRSSKSCRHITRLPLRCRAARTSTRCKQYLTDRGIEYEVQPAPGARPRLLHAHDVRGGARLAGRAEFRAGRRPLRRAGGIARLESALAGHRILDRRGPPGDDRGRRSDRRAAGSVHRAAGRGGACGTPPSWRATSGAPGSRWNWSKAS